LTGVVGNKTILCLEKKRPRLNFSLIDVEVTRCEILFDGCVADIVIAVDVTGRSL
jgi:hypothetical protein